MHCELRKVYEEGSVFVLFNKLDDLVAKPIGEILALRSIRQSRDIVRREIGRWLRRRGSGDVDVETMFIREVWFAAQVPFANARRGIASVMKGIRNCLFFEWQIFGPIRHQE